MSGFTHPITSTHRTIVLAQLEHHQAQVLATIARETGGSVADERSKHIPTATELRGIPAIGKGVAGAMRDTSPHLADFAA